MSKADRNGRKTAAPYVAILKPTLKEPAWRDLSYGARCLYIVIKSFYNGDNNGRLYLGIRKAATELGASRSSTERWFHELEDHGFIRKTEGGFLGVDGKGVAAYWRLTEVGYMGAQPTREFKNWQPAKIKTPSQKSGQTVPKIGTPCHENGDTCHENRDGFEQKSPADRPYNRDIDTCHTLGQAEQRWQRDLHERFVGKPEYPAIVDALTIEIQQQATEAEQQRPGDGLATVLRLLRDASS